jgi:hypothetical protein
VSDEPTYQDTSSDVPAWKTWGKRLGYVLGVLFVVGSALRLSLKTGPVRHWVKNLAAEQVNSMLNGQLGIGSLQGDLWDDLVVTDITLENTEQDTIATIDTLKVRYDLWALWDQTIELTAVDVIGPDLKIRQDSTSWNLLRVIKQDTIQAPADTLPSPYSVQVRRWSIATGSVNAQLQEQIQPNEWQLSALRAAGSAGYVASQPRVRLSELSLKVRTPQFDRQPTIDISGSASFEEQTFTLEQLLLGAGATALQAQGIYALDQDSIQADVKADPLSWETIQGYAQQVPVQPESKSRLAISVEGYWPNLGIQLDAASEGLDSASVYVRGRWDSVMTLQEMNAEIWQANAQQMLDTSYALPLRIGHARMQWQGDVPVLDPKQSEGKLSMWIQDLGYDRYQIADIQGATELVAQRLTSHMDISQGEQRVSLNAKSQDLYDLQWAQWQTDLRFSNINPTHWVGDTVEVSPIDGEAHLRGTGYDISQDPFYYRLALRPDTVYGQPLQAAEVAGSLTDQTIRGKGSCRLRDSEVRFQMNSQYRDAVPKYQFTAETDNFNLNELTAVSGLETQLRARLDGEGSGITLADLQLETSVSMDSSIVNRERIETFRGKVSVRDTVLFLNDGRIQSPIADGQLSLRQHLLRPTDNDNRLQMDLDLKNPQPLAPLLGTEELAAQGHLVGSIFPEVDGTLEFEASVDLDEIRYDSQYAADAIRGRIHCSLVNEPSYFLSLLIKQPRYDDYRFQDIELNTSGTARKQHAKGEADLQFRKDEFNQLQQHFRYTFAPDTTHFFIDQMRIVDPERNLILQRPAEGMIVNQTLHLDTLSLQSQDSVSLALAIPELSAERQQFYLEGSDINLGVLQQIVLGQTQFEGKMDGSLAVDHESGRLGLDSRLTFRDLAYNEVTMDTLRFNAMVQDRIMDARIEGVKDREQTLRASLRGPVLLPEDDAATKDTLVQIPLEGSIRVPPMALNEFKPWLAAAGWENTTGMVQFQGDLSGSVRAPQFRGSGSLVDGALSGVQVDSARVNVGYEHAAQTFDFASTIYSLHQKAMALNGEVPLGLSLENYELQLPSESDPIRVELNTNQFQLAALNDFVDKSMMRKLKGQVDGQIRVEGTYGDPTVRGELQLTKGEAQVVQAGIKIVDAQTDLVIRNDSLLVQKGSLTSGKGSAEIKGYVGLDGLTPVNNDLTLRMRNFKAANTRDYNATVNADARLSGSMEQPKVSGSLTFQNGFIYMRNFGEKSVETVRLDDGEEGNYQVSLYDSLTLDMDVNFNRGFYIRNRRYLDMEVELRGQIDIQKQLNKELELFGTLDAASGYARPLGKQFNIQTGQVTFSGNPYNPLLNIRTLYQPPQPEGTSEVKIWYIIEGRVDDPEFRYESEPVMELENIISYTLFGKPYYALESWEQVVTNSGADQSKANVALDVLLDQVEALATRRLGIDVVKIENNTSAAGAGTTIKTGWYINEKVFFAVLNEINGSTPNTSFIVEYMLTKNLDLILMQGDNNRTGVDIRWQYDY